MHAYTAYTVSSAHAALTSIVAHVQTFAACVSGDPVCDKLKTYAGWVPGWLQYLWILGLVLAVAMAVIGHRRGWDHMREVITGLIVASVLISGAATFVG